VIAALVWGLLFVPGFALLVASYFIARPARPKAEGISLEAALKRRRA
jgi:hypothetical protein